MDQSNQVPSIWTGQQEKPIPNSWLKTSGDPRAKIEQSPLLAPNRQLDIYKFMWKWPHAKERLQFFVGGPGGQILTCGFTGLVISKLLRGRFYLGHVWWQGFSSAYAAISISSIMVLIGHDKFVLHPLFLGDRSQLCLTCLQAKQMAINIGAAVVVPNLLLIPACCYYALSDPKYAGNVPRAYELGKLGRFIAEKYKGQVIRRMGWLTLINAAVGFVGPYFEMQSAIRVSMAIEDDPTLIKDFYQNDQYGFIYRAREWFSNLRQSKAD